MYSHLDIKDEYEIDIARVRVKIPGAFLHTLVDAGARRGCYRYVQRSKTWGHLHHLGNAYSGLEYHT